MNNNNHMAAPTGSAFDFSAHLRRQREWSAKTFGPGSRAKGLTDHIRKELAEIEAEPTDLTEWIDVVILALDGAWRSGATPEQIIAALVAKQVTNEGRQWPDWRTMSADNPKDWLKRGDSIAYAEQPTLKTKAEQFDLETRFKALAEAWRRETSGYSSVASMVMHPAYLEIISQGEKMIPFILRELQSRPGHWFIALKTLAKTSPVKPEDAGNIKKMTEAWLAWGKANGKLA